MSSAAVISVALAFSVFCASIAAYNVVEIATKPVCHDQDAVAAKALYDACMVRWMTSGHECGRQSAQVACKRWGRP